MLYHKYISGAGLAPAGRRKSAYQIFYLFHNINVCIIATVAGLTVAVSKYHKQEDWSLHVHNCAIGAASKFGGIWLDK